MENVNVCDCNVIHKEMVKIALENKPSKEELECLSQVFKLLGNLTRTKILWVLDKNEMYKGVLTENYVACEFYPK